MSVYKLLERLGWLTPTEDPMPLPNAPELTGLPLRYLIGADEMPKVTDGCLEVPYDFEGQAPNDYAIAYCNLYDENSTGKYGPYFTTDTAEKYNELAPDPKGKGFERNLIDQFKRRKQQGFKFVELDNVDAYIIADILRAVDLAAQYGFKVIAKNPLILMDDSLPYISHTAIAGIIVERNAGSAAGMEILRKRAHKQSIPVWFVAYGSGRAWAREIATSALNFKNMGVTYSSKEYNTYEDILKPRTQ